MKTYLLWRSPFLFLGLALVTLFLLGAGCLPENSSADKRSLPEGREAATREGKVTKTDGGVIVVSGGSTQTGTKSATKGGSSTKVDAETKVRVIADLNTQLGEIRSKVATLRAEMGGRVVSMTEQQRMAWESMEAVLEAELGEATARIELLNTSIGAAWAELVARAEAGVEELDTLYLHARATYWK